MPFGHSSIAGASFGANAYLPQQSGPINNAPKVTGISITPSGVIIQPGAVFQFFAEVFGENNPSQEVTWSVTIGSVDALGRVTAPAGGVQDQTGTLTATSVLDPSVSSFVSFAVPATVVDTPSPDQHFLSGRPDYQTNGSVLVALVQSQHLVAAETACISSSTVGGISQRHILVGANSLSASASPQDRILLQHSLRALPDNAGNTSPGAAVQQAFVLTAAPTAVSSSCSSGAAVQLHNLVGTPSAQSNTSVEGKADGLVQDLAAAPGAQLNASGTGAVFAGQILVAAPCTSVARSDSVSIGRIHTLSALGTTSVIQFAGAAVKQDQVLTATETAVTSASLVAPVTLRIALSGAPAENWSLSGPGSISVRHTLQGAASIAGSSASTGDVRQDYNPVGTACVQGQSSGTGRALQQHALSGADSVQNNLVEIRGIAIGSSILAGAPSAQLGQSGTGVVSAEHRLVSTHTLGGGESPTARITQSQRLAGVSLVNTGFSTAAAVTQRQILRGGDLDDQKNNSAPGYVMLEFNLSSTSSKHESLSEAGPIVISHDPKNNGTLQQNRSLGSGITCDQVLVADSVVQSNLVPVLSMEGLITIHMPPPEQVFEFKGGSENGAFAEYWE